MTTAAPTLFDWRAARDSAMSQVADNAGPAFAARAMAYIYRHLKFHGATSGEDLTQACEDAGIVAHDGRAFGPVFKSLLRDGLIERCGTCLRKKGHGTQGGSIYRVRG